MVLRTILFLKHCQSVAHLCAPPRDMATVMQLALALPSEVLDLLESSEEGRLAKRILAERHHSVQRIIGDALRQEVQHSFARIAKQAEAAKRVARELKEMSGSDDAIAVAELARELHESKLSALKWEAEKMAEELQQLKHAFAKGNWSIVASRARRLKNQAERFRDRYEQLHPSLQRLQSKMLEIAKGCRAKAQESNELIDWAQRLQDWSPFVLSGILVIGGLLQIVGTVCTLQALPLALAPGAALPVGVPIAMLGCALVSLGEAGCDHLRSHLKQMWAAEIQEHTVAKERFEKVGQIAEQTAAKLRAVSESSEAKRKCADMVVEAADYLAATAEDAQEFDDGAEELVADITGMSKQLDNLCKRYEQLPGAIHELQGAIASLAPDGCLSLEKGFGHAKLDDTGSEDLTSHAGLAMSEAGAAESADVEDGWILVKSLSGHTGNGDCLPLNTYILVPVEMAARLGALFAAGPGGNRICQLRSQGISERLMSVVSVGGALHRMTASHPFRVLRSGSWIHETASLLSEGDILATPGGGTAVVDAMPSVCMNTEEVFELQTQEQGEEIYIFTGTPGRDGAPMSLSGVAVLGSVGSRTRCVSAPPRLYHLPSLGSRLCKGGTRCSNVCRDFIRNRCLRGEDCSFCHRYHPEEPKRPPRGRREDARSSRST
ncbi:OLAH [Symbiodinium microadriaticum]|nr:OLAH [Symbiodinium microadriaticum]